MPFALYELRPINQGRAVRDAAILAALDLTDAAGTHLLMGRHLRAFAERCEIRPDKQHLLLIEVRKVNAEGQPVGDVQFRWALPHHDPKENR